MAYCNIKGYDVIQTSFSAAAPGITALQFELQITGPEQAMRDALAFAGADLCRDGPCRDNVDEMIYYIRTCDRAPFLFDTSFPWNGRAGGWLCPTS